MDSPTAEPPSTRGLTGGFAEYCYVLPRCKTVNVPDGLSPALAASATCALRTVVHAFEALGDLNNTESVVIQGSGPVGLYALAYALAHGADQVICLGAPADRLLIAQRWGATTWIDVTEGTAEERRQQILDLTGGRGADVVVECAGAAAAFEEGMDLVRRGGRYLIIGQSEPRLSSVRATHFNLRQMTVLGTAGADISHYYRALNFLQTFADRFDFNAILGDTCRLEQVDAALADLGSESTMKPVIVST